MSHKVGIWIDHRKAVVVLASSDLVTAKTVESDVGPHARYSERAADQTPDSPQTEAKLQLRERVSNSKVLSELAVEIESTDKLTDLSETKHRQEPRLLVPRLF